MSTPKTIGIDLGTTNSCVSIIENNFPKIILNEHNKPTTPSIVHLGKSIIVGENARLLDPKKTVFAAKRLVGRKFDDEDIKKYAKNLPFATFSNVNGDIWIKIDDLKISPVQIGGYVLEKMKQIAEKYFGTTIKNSVVTVPAYFNDAQRQATKDAGKLAGLNVIRVINEPTAAALAYGMDKKKEGIVAVYDLGGGTFDVSILSVKDGIFEVKSTNGNTFLGGEDIDNEFTDYVMKKEGIKDCQRNNLRIEIEKAKIKLSENESVSFNLKDKKITVVRSELEKVAKKFIEKTIEPCKKAISDAEIKVEEIDHVILVGGMTKMPLVRKICAEIFKKEPIYGVDPDEVVAKGAAIQAGILNGKVDDLLLLDVASLSMGIETIGGVFCPIVKRNTTLPLKKTQTFTTYEDNQTEIVLNVFQGERPLVKDNKFLGKFVLSGIPSAPKNVAKIEVCFEANADGIYTVSAKDVVTGKSHSIEIQPAGGLTREEIEKMIEDANKMKDLDAKNLERANLKVRGDELVSFLRRSGENENALELEQLLKNDFDINLVSKKIETVLENIKK